MRKLLPLFALLFAFPLAAADDPCAGAYASLNATLWQQTSAEYDAITRQVYASARRNLETMLAPAFPDPLGRPPAIILDADETVLDNSSFQSSLMKGRKLYTPDLWHNYALNGFARPIPAALDFLKWAASKNVDIYYVTNRALDEKPRLLGTFVRYGYPMADAAHVLTKDESKGWTSDKSSRRAFVASDHQLLMLFGDDLNDFVNTAGKTVAQRRQLVADNASRLGATWYLLPNAAYGSWETALGADTSKPDCGLQQKIDQLREDKEWH
ncbi:MAG TPA: HAD family acid phosphatase [Thermoanaerobaculia bacterium]|jgi:acid phosphatase|nr:HAD family acid phosphatase [Thermoanaerobaculia bacterium]